jgi:protein ImuB
VLVSPQPMRVVSASGETVEVSERCEVSAPPARVAVGTGGWQDVTGWAGPWPAGERWWDRHTADVRRRFQLTTGDGSALLVTERAGTWSVDAVYD